ncbi:hypothetical protein [Sphingosinicella sp. BN140058]|uniref:hypothetical protein n=1 Tax=Sphingosinicella sp. BN140058 TaxID=1892855 RepID=UPI001011FC08|nr:hypothetical protein [Sphingosinicella sp. BN140058]QAY80240.1 hypothetical protein ETR14_26720 [Sphingosinicella sp. BN140058]
MKSALLVLWSLALIFFALFANARGAGAWALVIVGAVAVCAPLWNMVENKGYRSFPAVRISLGIVATLFVLLGVSIMSGSGSSPEIDDYLANSQREIAAFKEQYPTEDNSLTWEYRRETDPMTDKVIRFACLRSANGLDVGYEMTRAKLCLRDGLGNPDAILILEQGGQFMCDFGGCALQVRVGKEPAARFRASRSSDGSPDVLFFADRRRIEQAIRRGSVLSIQAEVFQAGLQVMRFNTEGLKGNF